MIFQYFIQLSSIRIEQTDYVTVRITFNLLAKIYINQTCLTNPIIRVLTSIRINNDIKSCSRLSVIVNIRVVAVVINRQTGICSFSKLRFCIYRIKICISGDTVIVICICRSHNLTLRIVSPVSKSVLFIINCKCISAQIIIWLNILYISKHIIICKESGSVYRIITQFFAQALVVINLLISEF